LTKVIEKIFAEDNEETLHKRIVELEAKNSQLATATTKCSETIAQLQRSLANGVEDYNLLMAGNDSLLVEHNDLRNCTKDLESDLAKVSTATAEDVAALKMKIEYVEAHIVDVTTAGENRLKDFEDELVKDLAELHKLYIRNTNHIGGLCSSMLEGEPSAMDYIR
jgi:BMFP domain-containing protein YqiC